MTKIHLAVLIALALAASGEAQTNKVKRTVDRQAVRARKIAQAGGLVKRPSTGKTIMIVNDQKRVAQESFFGGGQESIAGLLSFPVKIVGPETDVSEAGMVITISDNATSPALMIAPEVPWAGVNVGALYVDKPSEAVLIDRVQKEIWRAFLFLGGSANSTMQPCVMRTIRKPADLDKCANRIPKPDVLQRVLEGAKNLGITPEATCSYYQACQEGWAPAPTNDLQRAIWEKVHTPPDKPLKIEFDPATQKGKVTK